MHFGGGSCLSPAVVGGSLSEKLFGNIFVDQSRSIMINSDQLMMICVFYVRPMASRKNRRGTNTHRNA